MEWWHYLIVGSAGLIAILAIVAISLLLVRAPYNYTEMCGRELMKGEEEGA